MRPPQYALKILTGFRGLPGLSFRPPQIHFIRLIRSEYFPFIPMLKRLLLALCLVFTCVLRAADTTAPFRAMLDRYYEEYLALFPLDSAFSGNNDPRYEAVWPND